MATIDVVIPPVIELNSPSSGYTAVWSTASGPVNIANPATATISDLGGDALTKLTVQQTSVYGGDRLAANTAGTNITAISSYDTLTLSGSDTLAHYQQVLRSIAYSNVFGGPFVPSLTFDVVATDDALLTSNVAVSTINIDALGPTVDLNNPSTSYSTAWSPASGPVNIASPTSGSISDTDSANLSRLTATITNPHAGDVLAANTVGTSITVHYGVGLGNSVLILSGADTAAHYQQVLRSITYDNTAGGAGVSSEAIHVVAIDDGGLESNAAVAVVAVANIADGSPTIVVGNHTLLPNTAHQEIDITVDSPGIGTDVQGVDLNAQVGDGGPPAGGTTVGPSLSADLIGAGTLFASNNTGDVDAGSFPMAYYHSTMTASGTVTIPSSDVLLVRLFIDTTGFDAASPGDLGAGKWSLRMGGVGQADGGTANGATDFGPILAHVTDGSVTIQGTATLPLNPVVDLNGPAPARAPRAPGRNAGPVSIATADASLTDAGSANLSQLTATLVSPHAGDVLAANTAGTNITASFGGALLTLSGNDTAAHYQQVLRSITYDNTAGGPVISSETIDVVAIDDGGLESNTAVAVVNVANIAEGLPTIVVGNHTLLPNTPHQEVDILVSSSGVATAVQGVDLNAQIGDGGPQAGGTDVGPALTADLIGAGTLFHDNNTGDVAAGSLPMGYYHETTTASDTVTIPTSDVLLVRLFIDTTGFTAMSAGDLGPGHWSLNMLHTANGATDFGPIFADHRWIHRNCRLDNRRPHGHVEQPIGWVQHRLVGVERPGQHRERTCPHYGHREHQPNEIDRHARQPAGRRRAGRQYDGHEHRR